jgi:exonuclease SbcD
VRLLHTGDWHLGKRLYGSDRLAEAERALDQIAQVADAEAVDAVLVAGDLLDRRLVDSAALDCGTTRLCR